MKRSSDFFVNHFVVGILVIYAEVGENGKPALNYVEISCGEGRNTREGVGGSHVNQYKDMKMQKIRQRGPGS